MILKSYKKDLGFTLIEILVVVAIISLLTILILPQYQSGKETLALQRSVHQLAQDIRRAQEMAMSARESNGVPYRYGIEFNTANPDYYFLFSDGNDNGTYQSLPSPDRIIEEITLERGVNIDQIFVEDPPQPKTKVSISFKPPDPLTEIKDPGGPRSITKIQVKGGSETKTVIVNKAGLIYVE